MTPDLILRLLVSAFLGGAIGFERSYRAKEAGIRTHFLVSLGSTLFMIISLYGCIEVVEQHGGNIRADVSRIAAQVVSGIGFIGAGTIIFQKHVIRGLTTAAGLWVTSAIGLTCGAGQYTLAIATTVMVLIGLEAHNWVFRRFGSRSMNLTFTARTTEEVKRILESFKRDGMNIDTYNMRENEKGCNVSLEVKIKRAHYESSILKIMDELEGVAVMGRDAILRDGRVVVRRGITLVAAPAILGVLLCQMSHVVIAEGLGQDARRRDGEVFAVALDDGGPWQVAVGLEAVAIDDDGLRADGELVEGAVHGEDGGVEDVYLVDFLRRDHADSPCHGVAHDDLAEGVALLLSELLGVVEGGVFIVGREDDGGGIDTAGKASAPRLVATGLHEALMVMAFEHGLQGFCII